ncbi:MAG: cyclopropane-fatty-acyl-phospholipid synthase family protein [Croceibacterium sp.]
MASVIGKVLNGMVTRGVLEIVQPDGTVDRFGRPEAGFPEIRVRLADDSVGRQLLLDPRLGAAEAFMDGRLIIERGDIMQMIQLLRSNRPWERGGTLFKEHRFRTLAKKVVSRIDQVNQQVRSKSNVAHHYDISNDLYRLFLDQRMQYSCAYWTRDGMTLDEAQEAKLAHIAAKLALAPGQTVLDIGCGWGGMAIYLAQNFDVRVTGITLSEEQLGLARERAKDAGVADKVSFELVDYRDLARRGTPFDRIVSVGMFEHVGRPQFKDFFRAVTGLLKDDGVMLLHTIGRMGPPGSTDAFTRKYIFPGGYIPALSETVAASEPFRIIASDVETLRLHYAKTLRAWYANCVSQREAIVALFDERFYRMWTFYLAGATASFEYGGMCNYQVQYIRQRHAAPLTRAYMETGEAALLGTSGPGQA